MVDKGFEIENDLPDRASLNIPPFMQDNKYLKIEEETKAQRIGSVKIHVNGQLPE